MNESELQRVYNHPIYPRDSKIYSEKCFVDFDNGSMGVVIGLVFFKKITNHFALIVSLELLINFY